MLRPIGLAAVALLSLTAPTALAAPQTGPQVIAAFSLAAPTSEAASGLVVRAVVPAGARCPSLTVTVARGGTRSVRNLGMAVRPAPARTAPAFTSITVCSMAMPVGALDASVNGVAVPAAMPSRIDRLALLGDSGCRIANWQVQDCSSPDEWPLALISQSVTGDDPDAIVFNGDFFYREAACPAGSQALCGASPPPVAGLPFTDSDYGWVADALLPMAPMLAAAPLIVTRGNHEACNRGGNGYFLLFDPRVGTQDTCSPVSTANGLVAADTVPTPTYALDLSIRAGRVLRMAVVDSAGGSDTHVTSFAALQRPAYESAATLTATKAGRESWLLTHRPVYGYVTTQFAQPGVPFNPWSAMDQTAASFGLLSTYDLVFSSHLHLAQAVQIPGQPGQLVLGNSGTLLDPETGYPLPTSGPTVSSTQGYPAPSSAWVAVRFGYALATPNSAAGSWRLAMKDPHGATFARCGLDDRQIYCRPRT